MIYEHTIRTEACMLHDITQQVNASLKQSGVRDGLCHIYCPHTTAAVTINENSDPDVVTDLLLALDKAFPDRVEFRHFEGNSAAHAKSSAVGCNVTVPVDKGSLCLGTWQGVYFCEFDGPRNRRFYVSVLGA